MKKKTIWTIAIIMGFSFLGLLFLQLKYIQAMVDMKKEQFDESSTAPCTRLHAIWNSTRPCVILRKT